MAVKLLLAGPFFHVVLAGLEIIAEFFHRQQDTGFFCFGKTAVMIAVIGFFKFLENSRAFLVRNQHEAAIF